MAVRKVEGLLRAGACVTVVAPELAAPLRKRAAAREIAHRARDYERGDLDEAVLVIAATDDERANRRVATDAKERGVLVNVVDSPELCSFIAPAVLDRGRVQVAVSTAGAAPALAAKIRDRLSEFLGPEYERVVEVVSAVRDRLRRERRPMADRERIMRDLAACDLPERFRSRDREGIDRILQRTVGERLTLVELGVSLD